MIGVFIPHPTRLVQNKKKVAALHHFCKFTKFTAKQSSVSEGTKKAKTRDRMDSNPMNLDDLFMFGSLPNENVDQYGLEYTGRTRPFSAITPTPSPPSANKSFDRWGGAVESPVNIPSSKKSRFLSNTNSNEPIETFFNTPFQLSDNGHSVRGVAMMPPLLDTQNINTRSSLALSHSLPIPSGANQSSQVVVNAPLSVMVASSQSSAAGGAHKPRVKAEIPPLAALTATKSGGDKLTQSSEEFSAQILVELSNLVKQCFSTSSSCRFCPREVVSGNEFLAEHHDCCSCDADFTPYQTSPSHYLKPSKKKSKIVITVDDVTYTLPYRTLTNSSFVKAKTKKYCQKNSILGMSL